MDDRAADRFRRLVLQDAKFVELRARAIEVDRYFDKIYQHADDHLWHLTVDNAWPAPLTEEQDSEEARRWRELQDRPIASAYTSPRHDRALHQSRR